MDIQQQNFLNKITDNNKKVFWPIKIAVGFMGLSAVKFIVVGVFFLIIFGVGYTSPILQGLLGIILSILVLTVGMICIFYGVFMIKYARAVLKWHKKGYSGAMALLAIDILGSIGPITRGNSTGILSIFLVVNLYTAIVLYYYRNSFIY